MFIARTNFADLTARVHSTVSLSLYSLSPYSLLACCLYTGVELDVELGVELGAELSPEEVFSEDRGGVARLFLTHLPVGRMRGSSPSRSLTLRIRTTETMCWRFLCCITS